MHKKKAARPIVPVDAAAAAPAAAAPQHGGKQRPALKGAAGVGSKRAGGHDQQQPAGKRPKLRQQQPPPRQQDQQQQQQQHKQQRKQQQQQQQEPSVAHRQQKQQQQQQPQPTQTHGRHAAAAAGSSKRKKQRQQLPPAGAAAAGDAGASAAAGSSGTRPAAAGHAAPKKPWHPSSAAVVGSNWQALQAALAAEAAAKPRRPRKQQPADAPGRAGTGNSKSSSGAAQHKPIGSIGHAAGPTPVVAMDCEMVGVGPGGQRDSLARVSVVNACGNVLLDSYVAQLEPVTDYRTWVSGIQPHHLAGAPSREQVQARVSELLAGRTLVGHGVTKDLRVLLLSHPRKDVRDTARFPPFMFSKGGKRRPRALKVLAAQELGVAIQEGEHSSVDDARAALYLYQKHAAAWERALKTPSGLKALPTANRGGTEALGKQHKKRRVESYAARDVADDPLADL